MPDWWKDMPLYAEGATSFKLDPMPNVTAKRCFPLLDSITAGYIVSLWSDVLVTRDERGFPWVNGATSTPVLEPWPDHQLEGFEIPKGYSKPVFKNLHGWIIKTPPGYSCLMTHPIGYPNLPFRTLAGVVDTDTYSSFVNVPFVIEDGFEGIIERGTPMFQVIPFKRESWKAEYTEQSGEDTFYEVERLYSKITSAYGRHMRQTKEYR
jgi:hypothetical protein